MTILLNLSISHISGATNRSNGAPPGYQVSEEQHSGMASTTSATSLSTVTSAFGAVSLSNGNVVAPPATTASLMSIDVSSTTGAGAPRPTTPTTKTTSSG